MVGENDMRRIKLSLQLADHVDKLGGKMCSRLSLVNVFRFDRC